MLDAGGTAAAQINRLWWLMFGIGGAVYVIVMGYLLLALFRRRATYEEGPPPEGSRFVLWAGGIIPALILVFTFGAVVYTLNALRTPDVGEELTIEVIGHQFWWEVRYPDMDVITANEIHIPVDEPVRVQMTSADVIHSFWVPELHGKLDLVPGRVTSFWLEANEADVYYGQCAELCGVQHANMQFLVIAEEEEQFEGWAEAQRVPATIPEEETVLEGWAIFRTAGCASCHAIDGTSATGDIGPNLTHLASRGTLAAATLPNTRGNLGGWIINPQEIKPGSQMPHTNLTGQELQALLTFLETLE